MPHVFCGLWRQLRVDARSGPLNTLFCRLTRSDKGVTGIGKMLGMGFVCPADRLD